MTDGDPHRAILAALARPPEDARSTYRRYLAAMRKRIVGNDDALRSLALAMTASVRGRGRRVVLVGPGAAYVARTIGNLTGPGAIHLSCGELTEAGWKGSNLSTYLDGRTGHPGQVVHVADLESVAVLRGTYRGHTDGSRESREGKQAALTALFAGEPVRAGRDGETLILTDRLLVIATAVLDLPEGPSAATWVEMGFTSALAEELASAAVVRLQPLTADETWRVLVDEVAVASAAAEELGVIIDADAASVMRIAEAVAAGHISLAEACARIRAAADRGTLALLSEESEEPGGDGVWVIALDDLLPISQPAKHRWEE